ncbi:Outer membrane protein TolC [Gammaproteobacteria bacterium]
MKETMQHKIWKSCRQTMLLRVTITLLLSLGGPVVAYSSDSLGLLDAVRLTLAKNPDIQLQEKQVEINQGVLQQATGQFDLTLRLTAGHAVDHNPLNQQSRDYYASQGFPVSQLKTETTSYHLALEKPLRNGMVLSPSVGTTSANGTSNDINSLSSQNRGSVDFSVLVPLKKGSGESAASGETAANLEWEASKQDLRHAISQEITNTLTAYWNLLAARKNLDIARETEASIRRMVDNVRLVIEADELPAADLNMVRANLLDKTASRISAEQTLLNARKGLGQAIGLSYPQITRLEPNDEFPAISTDFSALESQLPRLINLALKRRADLAAAQRRQDSARILASAYQNDLKPRFDLSVSVGYAGLSEGGSTLGGIGKNRGDPNVGLNLSYQWPFDNNVARGRYLQQSASYDQNTLRVATLERTIGIGVSSALSDLTLSALRLRESEETVNLYRISVENEKVRLKLGTATMVELLTVNDRLLNAELGHISYWLNYFNSLARLNFEAGTLLAEEKPEQSIRLNQLVSLPKLE